MNARIGYVVAVIFGIVASLYWTVALCNGDSPNDTFVLVVANLSFGLGVVLGVLTALLERAVVHITSTVQAQSVDATNSAASKQ